MDNIVVWIIGSNSSGKTTQARMLHEAFAEKKRKYHVGEKDGVEYKFTTFGKLIANVGIVNENDCCGVDTIQKKDSIRLSYLKACKKAQIVIIDGIMATGTWIDFIREVKGVKVVLVHLTIEEEANFQRVKQRRANKAGIDPSEVELAEKTLENLAGKIRSFQSLFDRMSEKSDAAIQVQATLSKKSIHESILNAILDVLDDQG